MKAKVIIVFTWVIILVPNSNYIFAANDADLIPPEVLKQMDPEIVSYLNDRFKKALESDAFTRLAKKANIEVQYRNGKDYVAAMSAMFDQVGSAMK